MSPLGVLMDFAKIELEYSLHHERMRERMTSIVLVIGGFGLTIAGWNRGIGAEDIWIGIWITITAAFGVVFSLKQYERTQYHYARYRAFRRKIDSDEALCGQITASILEGEDKHLMSTNRRLFAYRLNKFWVGLPALLFIVGSCLTGVAIWDRVALAEAPVAVFCEVRLVGNPSGQAQPAEPWLCQVKVEPPADLPFGANTEQITDEQHPPSSGGGGDGSLAR